MVRPLVAVAVLACLVAHLAACSPAPMPPPPQDAVAPADLAATGGQAPGATDGAPVANDPGTTLADGWVGSWQGPEGTSLEIRKQEAGYEVVVTNLDGPRDFHAVAVDDVLQFERDGVTESVHATDGKATGMKWLADKESCLTVKPGEGYCRG